MGETLLREFIQQRLEIRTAREVGASGDFHARKILTDQNRQVCHSHYVSR
jgi:hypothetical protein